MCISVGSYGPIKIHRITEYLEYFPTKDYVKVKIWCDLFFTNPTNHSHHLRFLHRGYVKAENYTRGWHKGNHLTDRIITLHTDEEFKIRESAGVVEITFLNPFGDTVDKTRVFHLAKDTELTPVVKGGFGKDAPYSLYEVGPFDGRKSHLLRIGFTIEADTYTKLLRDINTSSIYGDNLLLKKIKIEDFPDSKADNLENYERDYEEFVKDRILSHIYEIFIIEDTGGILPTNADPLTSDVSRQSVMDKELEDKTRWFISYNSGGFVIDLKLAAVA